MMELLNRSQQDSINRRLQWRRRFGNLIFIFVNLATLFSFVHAAVGPTSTHLQQRLANNPQKRPISEDTTTVRNLSSWGADDLVVDLNRSHNQTKEDGDNQQLERVAGSAHAAMQTMISDLASSSSSNILGGQEQHLGAEQLLTGTKQSSSSSSSSVEMNALIYLQRYGYMAPASSNLHEANSLISEDSFSNAISSFQQFAGIPQTGQVDELTLRFMEMPRCGNTDKQEASPPLGNHLVGGPSITKFGRLKTRLSPETSSSSSSSTRSKESTNRRRREKRYALQGSKWRRQELTYRISQYPTRFSGKRHEVDAQIEKAFGIWSQVAPINFVVKREGRVHIDIRFASGDHGDGDAFDGPGNTLAHAYFPQYGGDAHFDDQEYWTIDSYAGTNIFQVAAHELGHSLGLGHSNVREALMAPFYQKYKPNFKLHIDDILAIQALYGEKPFLAETVPQQSTSITVHHHHQAPPPPPPPPPPTTTTTTTTTPTTTTSTTTTTAAPPTMSQQPTTWYSIFPHGLMPPPLLPPSSIEPKPGIWIGARRPDPREGGGSLGDENENGISPDLPTLGGNGIGLGSGGGVGGGNTEGGNNGLPDSDGAPNQPGGPGQQPAADLCTDPVIDAITRTDDGSSYVFKGDYYWLLTSDGLAKGYPRKISNDWDGLPSNLDAALTWADGKTFFFKGNKYWRYRNRRRDVGYPKLISAGFAGIPDDIDAAFVWSGNGRTYIFKGTEYWRFDSKADPPVSSEYPRSIKVWNGVPSYVNAAFKWENNVTYFFKGSQYYRFNDKEFKVESRGRPPFPRQSAEWWFGCVGSNLAQRAASLSTQGSLKEVNNVNSVEQPAQESRDAGGGQESDWSYFAGLDETTRIMGTHISDHKPPQVDSSTSWEDQIRGGIGLGRLPGIFSSSSSSSSSSAITLAPRQSNFVVALSLVAILIGAMLTTQRHKLRLE